VKVDTPFSSAASTASAATTTKSSPLSTAPQPIQPLRTLAIRRQIAHSHNHPHLLRCLHLRHLKNANSGIILIAQQPITIRLPEDIDTIVRSLPNRPEWLREAILDRLEQEELLPD
jgi:hypothetical protein